YAMRSRVALCREFAASKRTEDARCNADRPKGAVLAGCATVLPFRLGSRPVGAIGQYTVSRTVSRTARTWATTEATPGVAPGRKVACASPSQVQARDSTFPLLATKETSVESRTGSPYSRTVAQMVATSRESAA